MNKATKKGVRNRFLSSQKKLKKVPDTFNGGCD